MTGGCGRAFLGGAIGALLVLSGCGPPPPPPAPYRFVDHAAGAAHTLDLQGLELRVLDPALREHVFPLADVPPHGTLAFSVGTTNGGRARFELSLVRAGATPTVLYARDVAGPGWIDARVPLVVPRDDDARLVFRTTSDEGTDAAWGAPVFLSAEASPRPSVILVSLDTLRADRVGAYGHADARTPALDRLAREGVLYTQAYSPSTWTLPSHQSLLGVYPLWERHAGPPLGEQFRDAGYLTAAFTGGGWLSRTLGFDRGFDTYYGYLSPHADPLDPGRFDGERVFGAATTWLEQHAGAPFFLFLHTYDVHDRNPFTPGAEGFVAVREALDHLPPEQRTGLRAYYDRLIANVDQKMGALLATLDRLGVGDRTLVVVTSDHGEAFWEHGFFGHGCLKPYEELLRVPLLLRWPKHLPAGLRVTTPVSLIDLGPTILALLDVPASAPRDGPRLAGLGLERPDATADARPVFVHCDDWLAVRDGRRKLLTHRTSSAPEELYDLEADPGERTNLAIAEPAAFVALRAHAQAYWRALDRTPAPARVPLDASTRERLRALGYVD